jgi:ElaB/YqjD/DUF883 family membrane-anchored ribosome-binding protein
MANVSANGVVDHAKHALDEAGKSAQSARRFAEDATSSFADMAREALEEGLSRFHNRSKEARETASDQLQSARLYVVDQVQERPFTTTLAALGAGFLIGLLFAGKRK